MFLQRDARWEQRAFVGYGWKDLFCCLLDWCPVGRNELGQFETLNKAVFNVILSIG